MDIFLWLLLVWAVLVICSIIYTAWSTLPSEIKLFTFNKKLCNNIIKNGYVFIPQNKYVDNLIKSSDNSFTFVITHWFWKFVYFQPFSVRESTYIYWKLIKKEYNHNKNDIKQRRKELILQFKKDVK